MDFIASQDKLAVVEVELWKAMVKWSTDLAGKDYKKTARDFLSSTLQFVRFATMTQDQIIKEVMPCKILSYTEVVSLTSTVSSGTAFDCIGLCNTTEVRSIPVKKISNASVPVQKVEPPTKNIFNSSLIVDSSCFSFSEQTLKHFTYIKIQPNAPVELQSLWVTGMDIPNYSTTSSYSIKYSIVVREVKDGFTEKVLNTSHVSRTVAFGKEIALSLVDFSGNGLLLDEKCYYNVELNLSEPQPAFTFYRYRSPASSVNLDWLSIHFKGQTHVRKITFKV